MGRYDYNAIRAQYRVGVFVDSLNLFCSCRDKWGKVIDHAKLMQVALVGHRLFRAYVYGIRFSDKMDSWIKIVERYGFEVKEKVPTHLPGGRVKANWDGNIIVDATRLREAEAHASTVGPPKTDTLPPAVVAHFC